MNRTATPLQIPDLATGLDYLSNLMLVNPATAERQLLDFLDALLAEPPDPGVLLQLLEQARIPLCFVEEEMARQYHNKPVPLSDEEEGTFRQVAEAWRKMGKAYALCARLEEPAHGNPDYRVMVATLLHRCLYYSGMFILEHYRARRELPPGVWLDLHGYYETAEEWGVACLPVSDPLESNLQTTHCTAAYVTLLLIDVASPYSHSVRALNLIRRWAGMWAPLVSIQPLQDDLEVPPYIVELMRDTPLHPCANSDQQGSDARLLDTTRLGLQINHVISQLRSRMTPSQLGLGDETAGFVLPILERLTKPWTQMASPRRFRRFPSSGNARAVGGFEAMYFHVTGQPFEQPDTASTYSREAFDALFTFRDRVDPGQALLIRPHDDFPVESWSVINHSASGFRLSRSIAGMRVVHGQLLAICPHDGERFLLGYITWLMQTAEGDLVAGICSLPGMPAGVRIAQSAEANERFLPAFLLPALSAFGEEMSLVLPAGTYHAGRELMVASDGQQRRIRMNHVLQRGTDFDRISYVDS